MFPIDYMFTLFLHAMHYYGEVDAGIGYPCIACLNIPAVLEAGKGYIL